MYLDAAWRRLDVGETAFGGTGEAYLQLSRELRTRVELGDEVLCAVARVGDVRFAEVVSPVTRLFEG